MAHKFGSLIRDNIISTSKKKKVNSFRSVNLLSELKTEEKERRKETNGERRVLIKSTKDYQVVKKEMVGEFK